jgi:hypothetical protein
MKISLNLAAGWLNPRRIRAHAIILALSLWSVCAVDFATLGLFDRAGNIKFQDFLPFYISAHLIAQGRTNQLYDRQAEAEALHSLLRQPANVSVPILYGPQVGLLFVPLSKLPFPAAAKIWAALSLLIYFGCVYLLWRSCSGLRPYAGLVSLCALAYPPLFHFFVRAQLSAVVLVCFTAAWLAFLARRDWLAGVALGLLAFKPQFLVAIPLVLLLAHAWRIFAGLALSAGAQLIFALLYFGSAVMRSYLGMLLHSAAQPDTAELALAPVQMHSLRSFWSLLIPWPLAVWALYILSSLVVVGMAAAIWKSSSSPELRFSALLVAAVLVNPHLYIYDLLALAPALLLLVDWSLCNPQLPSSPELRVLLYLVFMLPLFGPLSRWTHLQLSVPTLVALLWVISRKPISSGRPS